MDLRSIINTEAGENNVPKQAAPVTPIQAPPQQSFREYSHPSSIQASPGKPLSQDYSAQTGAPYASPSSYPGPYQGRPPPPPPIQAPSQNDLRSPARSYSAQSPYQHTPSTSSTTQYPFPQSATPQSPAQHQQYPTSYQQRDSYPQTNAPHLQHHNSQSQVSPAPQTPPIGIPVAHPYLQHQRSQSSLSAGTPTSAQSQQPYYNQYQQDSPISANHFPPTQIPQHQRQQSQPGTPLGPPLTQRQASGSLPQPTSPFQQRGNSSGPFSHFQQTSPAPPAPASIPRIPSTPSGYDSQRTSISEQQRRSQSERERSISVSPKTRLPSQPRGSFGTPQSENGYINSAKRKMDDRDSISQDAHNPQQHDPMTVVNGNRHPSMAESASPKLRPKKRIRYTEPPIWAQSIRTKGVPRGPPRVNGKQPEHVSSQLTPALKVETNGSRQVSPAVRPSASREVESDPSALLGPWETCITGTKPVDQMHKTIADFLFQNVVMRPDGGELASRGVEIEIEAKLGQLIDKDTNQRFHLPLLTACVVKESPRMGFKSSMTQAQHSFLNKYLNEKVADTHPNNQKSAKRRVPIEYRHRREIDKFYELPPTMLDRLPAAVREQLGPRQTVKVRVTYDQKTNNVLAAIVKARIADLSILIPQSPLDCRISINFEMKWDGDIEEITGSGYGTKIADRQKDRVSYKQGLYQVDLTQVTQSTTINGAIRIDKEHELEIEVSAPAIVDQGGRAMRGEPHQYVALVEGMVNNVFLLAGETPWPKPE
ncbi:CYTH-like domain-containing protein [Tricladium varicosporioides]|nr:CYTH-like domain-containing protein [Hymenoscyphus varicosporioides]